MIFIIGVGRSGTSLLQSMLNSHSKIAFLPETHYLRNYLAKYEVVSGRKLNKIISDIKNDKYLNRLRFKLEPLINKCINNNSFSVLKFYKEILELYKNIKNKKHIGDKDPKNIEYFDTIKKYFPDSYVIHIIRDPRDVVLSRLKAEWSKNRSLLIHSLIYEEQMNIAIRKGPELFGDRYIEVKYENLITDAKKTLRKLCKHLVIEFEEGMLEYMHNSGDIVAEDEKEWKKNVFKPVIKNNYRKWEKNMSLKNLYVVQEICKESMRNNGYYIKTLKRNKYKESLYKIIKNIFSILFRLNMVFSLYK